MVAIKVGASYFLFLFLNRLCGGHFNRAMLDAVVVMEHLRQDVLEGISCYHGL